MPDVLVNVDLAGIDRSAGIRAVFTGSEGIRALERGRTIVAPRAEQFRVDVVVTDYEGVTVQRSRSTPCRIVQPADVPATGADPLALVLVVDGELGITYDGVDHAAAAGDLFAIRENRPYELRSDGPFQLVRLVVPAERVPPRVLQDDRAPLGLVSPTRLTASVGAFLQRLSAGPAASTGPDRVYLARAVVELAVAVLTEAAGEEFLDDRSETLRARMRDHIDRNLSDPDLGPQQIAAALGVSVRYVHRVFNTGDDTVAKYIRERRLDAVARLLRSDARPQRVGALAARFGFSGRDHLTRAFRQQYGMTVREYQDAQTAETASGALLVRSGG